MSDQSNIRRLAAVPDSGGIMTTYVLAPMMSFDFDEDGNLLEVSIDFFDSFSALLKDGQVVAEAGDSLAPTEDEIVAAADRWIWTFCGSTEPPHECERRWVVRD